MCVCVLTLSTTYAGHTFFHLLASLLPSRGTLCASHSCCTTLCVRPQVVQLVAWIERFREWFASQLLKPLAHLMATAHAEPNKLLRGLTTNSEQVMGVWWIWHCWSAPFHAVPSRDCHQHACDSSGLHNKPL